MGCLPDISFGRAVINLLYQPIIIFSAIKSLHYWALPRLDRMRDLFPMRPNGHVLGHQTCTCVIGTTRNSAPFPQDRVVGGCLHACRWYILDGLFAACRLCQRMSIKSIFCHKINHNFNGQKRAVIGKYPVLHCSISISIPMPRGSDTHSYSERTARHAINKTLSTQLILPDCKQLSIDHIVGCHCLAPPPSPMHSTGKHTYLLYTAHYYGPHECEAVVRSRLGLTSSGCLRTFSDTYPRVEALGLSASSK